MLASFVVSLRPLSPAPLSDGLGAALHGLFFNLVRQGDAALAQWLHEAEGAKPFTVSPLRGKFRRVHQHAVAMPDQTYWVRYTTLSDELFGALNAVLLHTYLGQESVTLCGQPFMVSDVEVEPREHKTWGRLMELAELWQAAEPTAQLTLRFYSATAFKQRGASLLFPLPFNIFQSYREKWNQVCQKDLAGFAVDDAFLRWVEANVLVEAHELKTAHVPFGDFGLRGFVGWVRYVARDPAALRLKQWNALADFAFFCGTGMKTTQGMGQTRRVADSD
jgi:CRISPR-associated endoribonuclease Cas6